MPREPTKMESRDFMVGLTYMPKSALTVTRSPKAPSSGPTEKLKVWASVLLRFTIEQQTLWALYAHLQKALVTEGKVEKGSIVGKTGVSGRPENSLYPHLHFEIWTSLKAADKHLKQKHSLDPITILGPLPLQPLANEVIEAYTERA